MTNAEKIIQFLSTETEVRGIVSTKDISEMTDINLKAVQASLRKLVADGKVIKTDVDGKNSFSIFVAEKVTGSIEAQMFGKDGLPNCRIEKPGVVKMIRIALENKVGTFLTVDEIQAVLVKSFPGKSATALRGTIHCQLGGKNDVCRMEDENAEKGGDLSIIRRKGEKTWEFMIEAINEDIDEDE